MKVVITGVAGFIGSHLAEQMVADGFEVVGVDCFTDYYDPAVKRANIERLHDADRFELVERDLSVDALDEAIGEAEIILHLGAQPGVRLSWDRFETYVRHNVLATQRLLEAARQAAIGRFVFASSSSVYGNAPSYPVDESTPLAPFSPYGVTKADGEQLCAAYAANFGLDVVMLRYFTVYGPRQRPDMAIHRLVEAALSGASFPLYGAGDFEREFTFVSDVVAATALAGQADLPSGSVLNVAGGETIRIADLIALVEELTGRRIALDELDARPGDVYRNGGSIERATRLLGWSPSVSLRDGIAAQIAWHRERRSD